MLRDEGSDVKFSRSLHSVLGWLSLQACLCEEAVQSTLVVTEPWSAVLCVLCVHHQCSRVQKGLAVLVSTFAGEIVSLPEEEIFARYGRVFRRQPAGLHAQLVGVM